MYLLVYTESDVRYAKSSPAAISFSFSFFSPHIPPQKIIMYLQFCLWLLRNPFEIHNNNSCHVNRWDCCHGLISLLRQLAPNTANWIYIIYQCAVKHRGLREDSGDQYVAAGIDRTLNGGLTQCANSGNIFTALPHPTPIILLHICFKGTAYLFGRLKFSAEDLGRTHGAQFKGKVNLSLRIVSGRGI